MSNKEKKERSPIVSFLLRRPKRGFFSGLLIGMVVGCILLYVAYARGLTPLQKLDKLKEDFDQVIVSHFFGYTAQDFEEAVLGEAAGHQELVVMEQPLEVTSTVVKSGLGNLEIFSKTKTFTYFGKGVFTVDLSKIGRDHIRVDQENHIVYITIPHPTLQYIDVDLEKTQFEDTEKGFLAFGDITLTLEQQNEMEKNIRKEMETRLKTADVQQEAEEFGKLKTWEIFQPLITSLSPRYIAEIVYE